MGSVLKEKHDTHMAADHIFGHKRDIRDNELREIEDEDEVNVTLNKKPQLMKRRTQMTHMLKERYSN